MLLQIWLIWISIGLLVGVLAGLTGVGGALLGIPMFVYLAGVSFTDATQYALFVVFFSSLFNLIFQFKSCQPKIALLVAASAFLSSLLFSHIKAISPEWVIKFVYGAFCLYALYTIWIKGKFKGSEAEETHSYKGMRLLLMTTLMGLIQGGIVTLTGLGGGILMIPLLLGPLKLSPNRAVATSFLIITLSVAGSIFAQRNFLAPFEWHLMLSLAGAVLLTSVATKKLITSLSPKTLGLCRTWLFSLLILISALSLLFK